MESVRRWSPAHETCRRPPCGSGCCRMRSRVRVAFCGQRDVQGKGIVAIAALVVSGVLGIEAWAWDEQEAETRVFSLGFLFRIRYDSPYLLQTHFSRYLHDLLLQHRQILLHDIPDPFDINAQVLMNCNVPDA